MQQKARKLLIAAVGVATVNYVAVACGGAVVDTADGQDASTTKIPPTSGNLPGPNPTAKPTSTPPTSGNLPAPTSTPKPPPPPTSGNLPSPMVRGPSFSPEGGTFAGPVTVTMKAEMQDAFIFYTTDGSIPTATSTRYEGPITLTTSTTITAISAYPSFPISPPSVATFTIGDAGP